MHPHRGMQTCGQVPLLLMARRLHWKTQLYWEPQFLCGLHF
ncbi:unnamed protein product [Staurois parvus]|uniref:Uncharacterized protein n=1 Tax=Staurois parvus TaxID=386267 RepID=A0ABN9DS77_9NEOB|nr:unnamed protein product [Staurois parvus]